MPYTVTTPDSCLEIDADEHRVEGLFHVFRRGTTVMGHPRTMVVRRLRTDAVLTVTDAPSPGTAKGPSAVCGEPFRWCRRD